MYSCCQDLGEFRRLCYDVCGEEEISFQLAVVVQGSIPFANSWGTSHHQKNYIGAKIRVRDRNFFSIPWFEALHVFSHSRGYEPVQSSAEAHTAIFDKKKVQMRYYMVCSPYPRKAHQTNSLNLI